MPVNLSLRKTALALHNTYMLITTESSFRQLEHYFLKRPDLNNCALSRCYIKAEGPFELSSTIV